MTWKRAIYMVIFFICSSSTLLRSQDLTEKLHSISEITVQGSRINVDPAFTHTVLDTTQMEESSNLSFSELLTKHTPVFVKTYGMGSTATASFRGTGASHTQVEWNGININNPMLGQVDFSLIPVWMVDGVELYHGGSSLLVGSGALGGTILLNSLPKWERKLYGSVGQLAGSYGLYQSTVSLGGGNNKFQSRARYVYERSDNDFKYNNIGIVGWPRMKQRNADYRKHGVAADLFWNAGRGNVFSLNFWYHDNDRSLPQSMIDSEDGRKEWQKDKELRTVVKWKKYSAKFKSEFTTGFSYTTLEYYNHFISLINEVFLQSHTRSRIFSFYNRYNFDYNINDRSSIELKINADYHDAQHKDYKYPDFTSYPDRFEGGVSATFRHRFNPLFSSYVLLREDFSDTDNSPLIFSAGTAYTPFADEDLIFKMNGSRNFHRPTLNDLYWRPGGNPDLKPERGYTTDLSAEYSSHPGVVTYKMNLTGYLSWIEDWIIWSPGDNYSYWRAENLRKVFARGIESYASIGYREGSLSSILSANYAYTRTTNQKVQSVNDKSRGKQLIYIPIHKANVMLDISYSGWYMWWVWSVVSERFTTSSNEDVRYDLPAYDLHNSTFGKKINFSFCSLDIQFKVNNVFNRRYQMISFRPMPERNFSLSLRGTF